MPFERSSGNMGVRERFRDGHSRLECTGSRGSNRLDPMCNLPETREVGLRNLAGCSRGGGRAQCLNPSSRRTCASSAAIRSTVVSGAKYQGRRPEAGASSLDCRNAVHCGAPPLLGEAGPRAVVIVAETVEAGEERD
jgi:hypothetical protein